MGGQVSRAGLYLRCAMVSVIAHFLLWVWVIVEH